MRNTSKKLNLTQLRSLVRPDMYSKDEYLLRSLSKIAHKKWELFVVSRVLHAIVQDDLEYVCQQYVRSNKRNQYYLTDLCFPSLKLYCEVNEAHHSPITNALKDKLRMREIMDATEWEGVVIRVFDKDDPSRGRPLSEVILEVDAFVKIIRERKAEIESRSGRSLNWDPEQRYQPEPHIERGYIRVVDNVVFKTHRDALRLFGYQGGHYQRAAWDTHVENEWVWFPKLYPNKDWINTVSEDGRVIETGLHPNAKRASVRAKPGRRIVFAHYKNVLGQVVYKFLGVYELMVDKSSSSKEVYDRVQDQLALSNYL